GVFQAAFTTSIAAAVAYSRKRIPPQHLPDVGELPAVGHVVHGDEYQQVANGLEVGKVFEVVGDHGGGAVEVGLTQGFDERECLVVCRAVGDEGFGVGGVDAGIVHGLRSAGDLFAPGFDRTRLARDHAGKAGVGVGNVGHGPRGVITTAGAGTRHGRVGQVLG